MDTEQKIKNDFTYNAESYKVVFFLFFLSISELATPMAMIT